MHERYGQAAIENVIISKTGGVSDLLEVALLLKEVGLLRPQENALDVNIVPLFETIDDLARSGAIMDRVFSTPLYKRLLASRGAMQEVIAGSRPASRKKTTAIENLRAIPRVSSWVQCRLMLPGRFGFGAAVFAYLEPGNAWPSC